MKLKEKVLNVLENADGYVSGASLGERFSVSRNAIWKCINALKEDGYQIESTKNGYLIKENDRLSKNILLDNLKDKNIDIHIFDDIDSTNDEAKRMVINNKHLILANNQLKGRGRIGKSFVSFKSNAIYMTYVLSLHTEFESIVKITTYTALVVHEAIKEVYGIETAIKWVNDLYLNGYKVCGILTEGITDFETQTISSLIIGIGINLYPSEVQDDLKNIVGFLNCKKNLKNQLIATICNKIDEFPLRKDTYLDEYRKHSFLIGKDVTYIINKNNYQGTVINIDDTAALVVKNLDGEIIRLSSGEVSIKF